VNSVNRTNEFQSSRFREEHIILMISITVVTILVVYIEDEFRPAYSIPTSKVPHLIGSSNHSIPIPITAVDKFRVPILDYGYVDGIYVGPARNPITVASKASHYYSIYQQKHSNEAKQSLINNANWLVSNAANRGNYSILEYRFNWPPYGLKPPWYSGMAQAQAIQALIKVYDVTKDKKYLDTSKMLLNSFFVEVKDGGVTYKTPKEGWWYELYASRNERNEPRVLNGMIYSLLGIHDYYIYTHDPEATYLFDQGVTALKKYLPRYNYRNIYTYYDLLGNLSPLPYHKAVVNTLAKLYDITKEEIFKVYLDKWKDFRIK
jgi:heparosan-N-sulfate-glucuronate 5-epimerase